MNDELPDDIFDEPAKNEREILVRIVATMGEISTRAHAASQDRTVTEDGLRSLLEDISLDIAVLFVDARNIVEDESQGQAPGPSEN